MIPLAAIARLLANLGETANVVRSGEATAVFTTGLDPQDVATVMRVASGEAVEGIAPPPPDTANVVPLKRRPWWATGDAA